MSIEANEEPSSDTPGSLPGWYASMLSGLARTIKQNQDELIRKTPSISVAEAAWLARNLLELLIWTQFCCSSEQNAYRFYTDSLRDLNDGLKVVHKIASVAALDTNGILATRTRLEETAALISLDVTSESYKRVNNAAIELNKGSWFQTYYKLLSKFAHPTAAVVLMSNLTEPSDINADFQAMSVAFLWNGLVFAQSGVRKIVEFMKGHGGTMPTGLEERIDSAEQQLKAMTVDWEGNP